MVSGLLYGLKHGRVGLVAVAQGGDGIAAAEVLLGKHTANVLHAGNAVGHVFRGNLGKRRVGVIRLKGLLATHDAAGPALRAADAKAGIQYGPHQRQQQRGHCPAEGRPGVVFGQQGVADRNPRDNMNSQYAQGFKK